MPDFPFSSVLFDLDGTLVDSAPDLGRALNHVLTHNGMDPVRLEDVRVFVGQGARVLLQRGFAHYDRTPSDDELDKAMEQFLAYYHDNICIDSVTYDGVEDVLKELSSTGVTMAVCTNKTEPLSIQLIEHLGLSQYFATICGSDTVPNRKPHPDHILETLKRAQASSISSVMIGDSRADIESARAAGLPVVAMGYGYTPVPASELGADLVLDDFRELPHALRSLNSK